MSMGYSNPQSSGDTGSGAVGVNLGPHIGVQGGTPNGGTVTVGHTWIIVVGALALLWFLGYGPFRSVRM